MCLAWTPSPLHKKLCGSQRMPAYTQITIRPRCASIRMGRLQNCLLQRTTNPLEAYQHQCRLLCRGPQQCVFHSPVSMACTTVIGRE
ncbi:hypothetical protein F751_6620 [Auxenochlorella protothecoides]|uniref:Uncharacterized protein n=1 Tax=Auxenochlorella protothecoides TaxID=3075 RepID=A0A087SLQ9_AUXPR|nr:hypothetical protein F751_6620 [Auxenochlorella protothecoides]KFM26663.1 hypothetical protein F751_6620 [Auxenochlorella protothecoides]